MLCNLIFWTFFPENSLTSNKKFTRKSVEWVLLGRGNLFLFLTRWRYLVDIKNNKVICFLREIEFSLNKFVQLEMSAFKKIQWNLNHANLTPSLVHQAPSQSPSGNGVTLLWQRHNHSYLNHFLHNLIFMCGAALAVTVARTWQQLTWYLLRLLLPLLLPLTT